MSDSVSDDPFDVFSEEDNVSTTEEERPSIEELKQRMKDRKNNARHARIGKIKQGKLNSGAMTRIYYCENSTCLNIMEAGQQKVCSSCKCFVYCSAECQLEDWKTTHKNICGKNVDQEGKDLKAKYIEADKAAARIEEACCKGSHVTILHEKSKPGFNPPACIFSTIAKKSNVLHFSEYCDKKGTGRIFTTADMSTLGDFAEKIEKVFQLYPDSKVFLVSVMLDRVHKDSNTKCALRLYINDGYGEIIPAPPMGKNVRVVKKYQRVKK